MPHRAKKLLADLELVDTLQLNSSQLDLKMTRLPKAMMALDLKVGWLIGFVKKQLAQHISSIFNLTPKKYLTNIVRIKVRITLFRPMHNYICSS
jgi:hypothetical protein